ncbi:adenosylcobinamide-GDP ribazoletransferase [Rhizohabitans arisaemae]|uniref:adenosylcobinamide-GDP ribazoletransferase n=1 Tax=Rhizohabitans arisaemae TaxID=2720610 RepID=UPI0024B09FE5|nr:adenosylcobinamide-GDP ribazoletransferase [Rhizohabitans arisaemae]
MGWHGLRLAFGMLSVLPVRVTHVDRGSAGRAMLSAPLVGLVLGALAALPLALAPLGGPLLASALAAGALALLTRGLHLDGLADLADGLGSGKPAASALEIMKKSDIGPFGVLTLVFGVLCQVSALAQATAAGNGAAALITACVTGRLAITWACRSGVPSARPEGLGTLVAQTVRLRGALLVTFLATVAVLGSGTLLAGGWGAPIRIAPYGAALLAGLGAAWILRRHAVRRLGGITGDVLGALAEVAFTAAVVTVAILS